MPFTSDDYVPYTEDELVEQESSDLAEITNGNAEDFDGSAIQSLLLANARLLAQNQEQTLDELYDAAYIETAEGSDLDMKVRELGIQRKPATAATGVAQFVRETYPTVDYTVPSNLPITTVDGEVTFLTTESGVVGVLDDFDSSSLDSQWSGDTSAFGTQTTTVHDGSHALSVPATNSSLIYRTDETIAEGDVYSPRVYLQTNGAVGIVFAFEDDSNYYIAAIDDANTSLELIEVDGGGETVLDSVSVDPPTDEWTHFDVDWQTTDDVGVVYRQRDGTAIDSVSGTIDVNSGGVGVESRDNNTTKYVDTLCRTATTLTIEGTSGGVETNVGGDRITVMETQPTGIDAVTNPLPTGDPSYDDTNGRPFVVGTDRESDEELRERALQNPALGGAATVDAVASALNSIEDVIGLSVFENDSTSTDGDGRPPLSIEPVVYGGSDSDIGQTLHETVAATERTTGGHVGSLTSVTVTDEYLTNDETYEFSRPGTDALDVTLDIVVDDTYEGDSAVTTTLVEYIGGIDTDGASIVGRSIGEDVIVDAIRDELVGDELGVVGIASITIDSNGDTNDDTTTGANGLRIYDVADSDVAEVDATDGSISITTTVV